MGTQTSSSNTGLGKKAVYWLKVIPIALLLSMGIFAALQPIIGDAGAIVGFLLGCYLTRFYYPVP
ncbi:hypothetical protein [Haladaptatus halobius]|uniref:hypothetical protein n=1 Tax=Haladaptatus halobius TaxID=2884875 RepID=UPI001D0B4D76|nr:hypothetical protein [Haladaptatus halobius]